jgi:hypothetical protein
LHPRWKLLAFVRAVWLIAKRPWVIFFIHFNYWINQYK